MDAPGRPLEQPTDIEAVFPGWSVWRSDGGRWWAARLRDLRAAEINAGLEMTVEAATAERLIHRLRTQAEIETDLALRTRNPSPPAGEGASAQP